MVADKLGFGVLWILLILLVVLLGMLLGSAVKACMFENSEESFVSPVRKKWHGGLVFGGDPVDDFMATPRVATADQAAVFLAGLVKKDISQKLNTVPTNYVTLILGAAADSNAVKQFAEALELLTAGKSTKPVFKANPDKAAEILNEFGENEPAKVIDLFANMNEANITKLLSNSKFNEVATCRILAEVANVSAVFTKLVKSLNMLTAGALPG